MKYSKSITTVNCELEIDTEAKTGRVVGSAYGESIRSINFNFIFMAAGK